VKVDTGMEAEKKRKRFDRQSKLDAVNLVINGERSVAEVARDLGIEENTVYRWSDWRIDKGASP